MPALISASRLVSDSPSTLPDGPTIFHALPPSPFNLFRTVAGTNLTLPHFISNVRQAEPLASAFDNDFVFDIRPQASPASQMVFQLMAACAQRTNRIHQPKEKVKDEGTANRMTSSLEAG
jgi:hypothetical protein